MERRRTRKKAGELLKDIVENIADPQVIPPAKAANIRERVARLLEQEGLGLREIVKRHREQLDATRLIVLDGQVREVPDYSTRQKAISDAYSLHGAFEAPLPQPKFGPIVLHLTLDQIRELELIRGGPLPENAVIPIGTPKGEET
jgi:hypothetical protein